MGRAYVHPFLRWYSNILPNIINFTTALPITSTPIGHLNARTVDARNLHDWLGVTTPFHKWFERRMDEYGFQEETDFRTILSKTSGRPRKDYALTLDMAKELAMVERNDQGRAARKYFISMEKQAKDMFSEMQGMATMSRGELSSKARLILRVHMKAVEGPLSLFWWVCSR